MRIIVLLLLWIIFSGFNAADYSMVYDKELAVNKTEKVRLMLYDANAEWSGNDKTDYGFLKITGGKDGKIDYFFEDKMDYTGSDEDRKYDWFVNRWGVEDQENAPEELVDMYNVSVIDTDNNGQNEIYVYGEASHGSGWMSKVFSFEKKGNRIIRKYPVFTGVTNDEIYYYAPLKIFIMANYIWRTGEARVGGEHNYKFYVSEVDKGCREEILLDVTKSKYNSEDGGVVRVNLAQISEKYRIYKKGKMKLSEKDAAVNFVRNFWADLSAKNTGRLAGYYADKVKYFSSEYTGTAMVREKESMLEKFSGIKFDVDEFLVYKEGNATVVEYDKEYKTKDESKDGRVRSYMKLVRDKGDYKIAVEDDMVIYGLASDIKLLDM